MSESDDDEASGRSISKRMGLLTFSSVKQSQVYFAVSYSLYYRRSCSTRALTFYIFAYGHWWVFDNQKHPSMDPNENKGAATGKRTFYLDEDQKRRPHSNS